MARFPVLLALSLLSSCWEHPCLPAFHPEWSFFILRCHLFWRVRLRSALLAVKLTGKQLRTCGQVGLPR